ncbi:MAG TPA: alpha/beta hydrolase-fold protein [Streptosporangiaceae bacterium]|nr:alpha/beta hydrolase-fold protein [Streptosporangiaceae bacterium]
MPEPQSTAFFVLMMVIFAALIWWLVVAKQLVFRVLAACLAFVPAVAFGIAAVNKYYDYYQNWGAAFADLSNSGVQTAAQPGTHLSGAGGVTRVLGNSVYVRLAAQEGFTFRLWLRGTASHLARNVYVYLPPQYFQTAYRRYRFPVVELIHGFPGEPQDWITVVGVTTTLSHLISSGLAKPVVLVMPDANGARGVSLQCLNQVNGPQDATYLAQDVPFYISHVLRVRPPGRSWGIAGYSEGGYCAANLGLQFGHRYGFAGVLSGYFTPLRNQLSHPSRRVSPFGGNKKLQRQNTPTQEILSLPAGTPVPQFWIGAGYASPADVRDAQIFRQLVQVRQPTVVLRLLPGGGHTMFTWRLLVSPMLQWMTPRLAANAAQAAKQAQHKIKKKPPHHHVRGRPVPTATPLRLSVSPRPSHAHH